jgi:hypothetical protein
VTRTLDLRIKRQTNLLRGKRPLRRQHVETFHVREVSNELVGTRGQGIKVGGTFGGISACSVRWTVTCFAVGSSILVFSDRSVEKPTGASLGWSVSHVRSFLNRGLGRGVRPREAHNPARIGDDGCRRS